MSDVSKKKLYTEEEERAEKRSYRNQRENSWANQHAAVIATSTITIERIRRRMFGTLRIGASRLNTL
jgi:hypothetical protein